METPAKIIFVTGCSSGGIGFEVAVQLISQRQTVVLGIRSPEKRLAATEQLGSLALPGKFDVLELDVAHPASIASAARVVADLYGRLDALVNNAGVGRVTDGEGGASEAADFAQCFQVNATGPYLLVEAFAPLLRKTSGTPRIVNVSSGAGSIRRILDTGSPNYQQHRNMGMSRVAYGASKAALNLLTAKQAVVYGDEGFKVFAYSPGFVVSNLGPFNKAAHGAQPTSAGAAPILRILSGERDAEHGCFLSANGQYEW